MQEEVHFDLMGQRRLIFDDVAVTHFSDEIYFALPILLPGIGLGLGYSVVTQRPIAYRSIRLIGVIRKRQWWALVMGLILSPLWLWCLGGALVQGDWSDRQTWWIAGFCVVWLVITGIVPLWLFYRGRPFMVIASERDAICIPLDRIKQHLRRAFALLKMLATGPEVRWELKGI
jgi:hypothetical protein